MHPGTPCVFYDHFWDQGSLGQAVRKLLKVRRTNGIHARSKVSRLLVTLASACHHCAEVTRASGQGCSVAAKLDARICCCGGTGETWSRALC